MGDRWQLQEAKQRFSQLIRAVESQGPQIVTRHGKDIAVVIEVEDYHRIRGGDDFKKFLCSVPDLEGIGIVRDEQPARRVEIE